MYGAPLVSVDSGPMPGVPLQQPANLFRFGEITIWSSQMHQAGLPLQSGTFRLFSTPIGNQGQGFTNALSITETNLKEGGRVPSGVAYDVFTMSNPIVAPGIVADLLNIVNNGILSWDFTQTQVDICPVMLAGAGGGAFGAVATADTGTPVTTGTLQNGNGGVWMYRKHPVALPGNSTFAIVLRYGSRAAAVSAANSIVVRVVLMGYYKNIIEIG